MNAKQIWIGAALAVLAQVTAAAEPLHAPGDCPFLRPMAKCPPRAAADLTGERQDI